MRKKMEQTKPSKQHLNIKSQQYIKLKYAKIKTPNTCSNNLMINKFTTQKKNIANFL